MSVIIGSRVSIKDKDLTGTVAYIGSTDFAPGNWVGVSLDTPKGKNNGTVQGKEYFNCKDNHGMFVRAANVTLIDGSQTTLDDESSPLSEDVTPISRIPSSLSRSSKSSSTPTGPVKSRLPLPGRGPTSSRSPSFTDLKGKKIKAMASPAQSRIEREPSFIEPNFIQTMRAPTQFSPAPPSTQTPPTERTDDRTQIGPLRDEVKDLNEKLETLKIKRAKDIEKLKDYEKLKIQYDQLTEFKTKIMESQSSLQKEVQKARHEAREAIESKEKHADEMLELSETVEMLTLDKEMAEEKAETIQIELELAREKIEELTLDLDIIKTEMDGGINPNTDEPGKGITGEVTHYELKHLTAQNEKLRETLVRMRDLSAHEKNELTKFTKDMESMKAENSRLTSENVKLKEILSENEKTVSDLQEQVDAAMGSEEMVDNLTVKCLDLEDRVQNLIEEKEDLEFLHDMNEELQENARETEIELREELDGSNSKIIETIKERDAAYEIINDHELTIRKFRELVGKVQEQNQDLRISLEKETNKPVSTPAEMIDFNKMFAETKAHSKAIDMELRRCETDQSVRHIRLLTSYMSDSFMNKGGDHEAILVLLLVPRLLWKSQILIGQIKEKFQEPEVTKASIEKGHSIDQYIYGLKLSHSLHCLIVIMSQFQSALETCNPEIFLKIGTLYPEMAAHEKLVDFYIDLLRKDQLDENVPEDNLTKCLFYFESIFPLHLSDEKIDNLSYVTNHIKAYSISTNIILTHSSIGKVLLTSGQEDTEAGTILKTMETDCIQIAKTIKTIKRRLPGDGSGISFSSSIARKMAEILNHFTSLVKVLNHAGKLFISNYNKNLDVGVSSQNVSEFLNRAVDEGYESPDGIPSIRASLVFIQTALEVMEKAILNGEWDTEKLPEKPIQPVVLRSQAIKSCIKEAEGLKYKLENKDFDIKELKKALKIKGDEVSQMQVRKNLSEKKLTDTMRDCELVVEKLQRKLDDTNGLLKRKEKEFEETMDHLQADIESLESERGELKDKVRNMSKKALIEGISKSHAINNSNRSGEAPMSMGPSVPCPVKDSPNLLRHVKSLETAMQTLLDAKNIYKAQDLKEKMASLKPIDLNEMSYCQEKQDASKDDVDSTDINGLMKQVKNLQNHINKAMIAPLEVVDISRKKATARNELLTKHYAHKMKVQNLQRMADDLNIQVTKVLASKCPGGTVQTDLNVFPSIQMSKVIKEKDYTLYGKLSMSQDSNKTIPLLMNLEELRSLHTEVLPIIN